MALTGSASSRALVDQRWLATAAGVAGVGAPLAYAALALVAPGLALLLASLLALVATGAGVLLAWPVERKITWQRQAEVLGYRVALALAIYVGLGFLVITLANLVTGLQIPTNWPGDFLRRVPFWPFYGLIVVACHTVLPAPPDACPA